MAAARHGRARQRAGRRPGPAPPALPSGLAPYQSRYRNWVGEIRTDPLWTCSPRTPRQVADLANWAREHGWRLRTQGRRHTWTPLTVADGTPHTAPVLLVDTTRHLNTIALKSPSTVRVQTGATMERLLAFLGDHRLGVTACPAPGDLTVGGVLAIGGHGTAAPAAGERRPDGHGYGTLSNQITELTAVGGTSRPAATRSAPSTAHRPTPPPSSCIWAGPSSPRSSYASAPTSVCAV